MPTPPLRPLTRQEQEAAMGQELGQGRGFLADRKTRPESPLEWEAEGRAMRPTEGRVIPPE